MQKPVLVIKLGTAVITDKEGKINDAIISRLASEISELCNTYRVVLVSSGAVGCGKAFINNYKGSLIERKAAAAVGNPVLIQLYHQSFSAYGIPVAQALCERHHFSNRTQFLQLKETFVEFWNNNILPVVNENDLVSNVELKFSDNDELSTLIAIGFDATTLILCTSVGGFLNDRKEIVPFVEKIDNTILGFVNTEKSAVGLGGMVSKLTFTRLATAMGIQVIMTGLAEKNALAKALAGEQGTTFKPKKANLKARQKWLASGSITLGSIHIDKGAEKALTSRKSLLAVGVRLVEGRFSAGEVVQLLNEEGRIIGVAKVRLPAEALISQVAQKNALAAHSDDIVLF